MSDIAGKSYIGTEGNDVLKGSRGDDFISSGLGNDTINAGAGDDMLWVGSAAATIDGGSGADDIFIAPEFVDELEIFATVSCSGGSGDDTISSGFLTLRDSVIHGGTGNDIVSIYAYNASVTGGSGNDTLSAVGIGDTLQGGDGNDDVSVYNEAEMVDSFIFGGSGSDTLTASGWDVTANGGAGNDVLWAHGSEMTLIGGTGKDQFGMQYVSGGYFNGEEVVDMRLDVTIQDFTRGQDKLWITADLDGKDKLSFAELTFSDSEEGLHVSHVYTSPYYETTTVVDYLLAGVHEITAQDVHFMNSHGL